MKMPRYGRTSTRTTQPVFAQPLMSCRLNRSPKTVKRSQKKMIQAKNTNIVHITSPNEYAANTAVLLTFGVPVRTVSQPRAWHPCQRASGEDVRGDPNTVRR